MPRLENWSLIDDDDPYYAPELRSLRFCGQVYDHPEHMDGTFVRTSTIVGFKVDTFKTASGSLYVLGKVLEAYEQTYPNALLRILESATKTLPKFED